MQSKKEINVLFVCLGNICRSPLAEAIFAQKVKLAGLENKIAVDSCGTGDYHIGELPDERTLKIAEKNHIPVNHRARQFDSDDFENFDRIIVMDRSNLQNVKKWDKEGKYSVKLMRDYDSNKDSEEVPDPYWGGMESFQEVFDILDRSTQSLLEEIIQKKH